MSSMVPISLRDPFWDDPHFSSSRGDFDDMRRQMMRDAKDFWSRVDDNDFSSSSTTSRTFSNSGGIGGDDDLEYRTRRLYSNPATAVPGWMMPRRDTDVSSASRYSYGRGDNQLLRITDDDAKFEITLDVHNYRPDEIKVRTTPDNLVVIDAKHEEKSGAGGSGSGLDRGSGSSGVGAGGGGYSSSGLSGIYRSSRRPTADTSSRNSNGSSSNTSRNYSSVLQQFSRSYSLPSSCDPLRVVSNLSRDGVLVITAPKRQPVASGRASAAGGGGSLDRNIPVKH